MEVLGKPKEYVEASLKDYIKALKEQKNYQIIHEEYAELKKQDQEMWSTFAELEIRAERMEDLINFCLDYMPAMIEVLEPEQFSFADVEVSEFLNDLQAKLHRVDLLAKHLKTENDYLKKNMAALLKNYLIVLLSKGQLTALQLHKLTGVEQNKLEDYLDLLIDEGKVDLKEGAYYLTEEALK